LIGKPCKFLVTDVDGFPKYSQFFSCPIIQIVNECNKKDACQRHDHICFVDMTHRENPVPPSQEDQCYEKHKPYEEINDHKGDSSLVDYSGY